jgi:hypothetical protein
MGEQVLTRNGMQEQKYICGEEWENLFQPGMEQMSGV